MKILQNIYGKLSATFALIPGLIILTTNLGVPPNSSEILYFAIIESIGSLTILFLWVNRNYISDLNNAKINKFIIISFIMFIIFLIGYIIIFDLFIIYSTEYDRRVFFPFWSDIKLELLIDKYGSKLNAINELGPQAIIDFIYKTSRKYLVFTNIIFLCVFIIISECLVIPFTLLAIRKNSN